MTWTYCLNVATIKPQPLMDKIRLCAEAGFDGIELWINDIYEYLGFGGDVCDVEKALSDYGLIVPSVIAIRQWGDFSGWEHQLVLDEAKRRFALGARLGAPYIVATPPLERADTDHLPERYRQLLQIGRETGIKPTFEYISFFKSIWSLSQAWQMVQAADDPDATLIVDAFHNWNSESTLEDLAQIPAEKISHYHFDDAHPDKPPRTQTDPDRVMPGDGQIDLATEIRLLGEIGYSGTVSLELFNAELWARDPKEVLSLGLERMKQFFEAS
ncbi:MAG: sugar phosphate isomerase/epimerase [Phycisphaeraceae bacterium]|nr:sugar phosphate isomerase/epimerase [Phycisphaeraceae bacterium]